MPEVQSVSAVLDHAFEAFNQGDPEPLIDAYATRDVVLVGTRIGDVHRTPAAIASALRADRSSDVRVDWQLEPVDLADDAMLLFGRLSFVLPDGQIFPARASYVLRREGAGWRIAHSHLSIAVEAG